MENPSAFELRVVDPSAPEARNLVRDYFGEILTRVRGHPPSSEVIDSALRDDPDDAMVAPTGTFLVALSNDYPVGCAGLRVLAAQVGELKRVYVRPSARGRGLGTMLVTALEEHARSLSLTRLRLDTRHELDEALRIYERRGYHKIERYKQPGLADLWFEKAL